MLFFASLTNSFCISAVSIYKLLIVALRPCSFCNWQDLLSYVLLRLYPIPSCHYFGDLHMALTNSYIFYVVSSHHFFLIPRLHITSSCLSLLIFIITSSNSSIVGSSTSPMFSTYVAPFKLYLFYLL